MLDLRWASVMLKQLGDSHVNRLSALVLLLIGTSVALLANPGPPAAPEIDPGSAVSALALVSGALLVIRGRRKA